MSGMCKPDISVHPFIRREVDQFTVLFEDAVASMQGIGTRYEIARFAMALSALAECGLI